VTGMMLDNFWYAFRGPRAGWEQALAAATTALWVLATSWSGWRWWVIRRWVARFHPAGSRNPSKTTTIRR
jgi:hypothetical protein